MKTPYLLLTLACSAPALLSCSLPLQQSEMRIEPLLRIRNSDSSAGGFYQLGRYYQLQNRYTQAAEAYRSALRHDPDNIDAHSALGSIYSIQGKYDAAIAEFTSILKTAPQLAYIHNNMGYAHYLQGDHAAAVAAFEQAIALEPQNLRALNNLGLAHQKMGDAKKSRVAFSQAAQIPGATGTFLALAADAGATPVAAESVPLPTLSASSVALESSAPAVSLAVMPVAAAALAPAADGNDANVAVAPQESGSVLQFGSVLQYDTLLGRLFSAAAPATAVIPAAADSRSKQGKTFHLEIANGNGVTGFARKIGDKLALNGLPKPKFSNLNSYRQHRTVIQYRAGFRDEAVRVSRMLQTPPVLLSDSGLRKGTDVRLILGNDVVSKSVLLLSQDAESVRLADAGSKAGKVVEVALRLARKLAGTTTHFL
jgi:Tfp pilus assembly protein PilF